MITFGRYYKGYGWYLWLGRRVRYNSPAATSRRWPSISKGGDEYCNDTFTVLVWPLGHVDVWWRWRQRTEADGQCEECLQAEISWC